jgi:hypothetical protein
MDDSYNRNCGAMIGQPCYIAPKKEIFGTNIGEEGVMYLYMVWLPY